MNAVSTYSIRPKRMVYYLQTSKQDIDNFLKGIIPDALAKYKGAFGTYGNPALFILNTDGEQKKVLGVEYRPNDERILYPADLDSFLLDYTFFRSELSVEDMDEAFNDDGISSHVEMVCGRPKEYHDYLGGKISVQNKPELVQIYRENGYCRVMISADFKMDEEKQKQLDEDTSPYKHMYYRDSITGYYNFNYIWPRMSMCSLYGIQDYVFVYFDIKEFKAVNVLYGHWNANDLLISITKHMEQLDWVYCSARCDNDNFAMMIRDMPEEETKEKLKAFFESVSYLDVDPNYKVYYRCGVVPMRITTELGILVADAGKQAKTFGKKPYRTEIIYFTDAMREEKDRAIYLRTYLDTAIKQDEFMVYLQPKYDILTEKIKGAEALIRWKYKGKKLLSPGAFVPMFEEGGLISKLDDIVLKKVCIQLKEWEKQGKQVYPISVNVSRKSIGIPGLVEHLTEIVDSYDVDHSLIDFELTESAAYENQNAMIRVIKQMKENGFCISMDDFGTGYSSLSLLPIMPIDTLKIDKSFVDRIGMENEDTKSCVLVRQIVALTRELQMTCLAEGAEEAEQVTRLREYGCEIVQGYYYSKPIPMEEYEKLL